MLHHIEISNFRALEKFRMEQLGRVNLLVGTNNCGKTSVLEAISILMIPGSSHALWHSLFRRGEIQGEGDATEVEIRHLFHGHNIVLGATFTISGKSEDISRHLQVQVAAPDQVSVPRLLPSVDGQQDALLGSFDLSMTWALNGTEQALVKVPLTRSGGLLFKSRERPRVLPEEPSLVFITTEALTRDEILALLEQIMLTPEEDLALAALRTIEPRIERIAPLGAARRSRGGLSRDGIAVKLSGERLPIGSLGDGIWRLLGIALALVRARGGVLLVDEIDTGLHYSVLEKMWHLVYETAKRLDVQVFATTHSRDCFESLAAIAHPTGHDVTIQRIERGKPVAVAFSEAEILQAAKRSIEVR